MDRRDFIRRAVAGLAGTAVAAEFDLERLLWVPKPTIVVPSLPAHAFTSIRWVTKEALRVLNERLALTAPFTRAYDLVDGHGGITHLTWVRTSAVIEEDFERRTLAPAMAAVAQHVQERGATVFGRRPQRFDGQQAIESAVVVDPRRGVAVRGTRIFDIEDGREQFQFHVCTGRA